MRVRDDPRAAAELFCRQHGVTDAETINRLEETLRGLYFSPSSSPPPLSPRSPPLRPASSTIQPRPRTPETSTGLSMSESHTGATPRGETSTDAAEEDVLVRTLSRFEALGAGEDSAYDAGGPVQNPSEPSAPTAAQVISDAVGTSQRATNQPPQHQRHRDHQQQHDQQHQHTQQFHEPNRGRSDDPEAESAAGAAAGASAVESPPKKNVTEIAAGMRDAAKASHDPTDPDSVLVDLVVNGYPAPLVFRVPRNPTRIGRNRRHEKTGVEDDNDGHEDGHHGGGGSSAEAEEEAQGVFHLDGSGVGEDGAVRLVSLKGGGSGTCDESGGGDDDAETSRRQPRCSERGVHEEAGDMDGKTQEELQEQAVAAAAREWCGAFGSDRAEDITFVEAEIKKTVVVTATAAAQAEAASVAAATAAAAAVDAEREIVLSGAGQDRPRSEIERPERTGLSATVDGPAGGMDARQGHEPGGGRGKKDCGKRAERLTVTSALAPDVEKGTSMFWVKVDPSLPELYVTAGLSALELSESFCKENNLGSSQVPLVAWKVLEAYPLQMQAARRDGTLPPARITLGYAVGQREVQVALVLLIAALLWVTRRGLSGWLARGTPTVTGSHQRQGKRGTKPTSTKRWAFGSAVLPSWARWPRNKKYSRGHKFAILPREPRKTVSHARNNRGTARGDTSVTKNDTGASAGAFGTSTAKLTPEINGDDETGRGGGGGGGGGGDGVKGDSPRYSSREWWASRLSTLADAALFESGRIAGASVRAVVRPLAYVCDRVAGANTAETRTPPSPKMAAAAPSASKGSKRPKKGSGKAAGGGLKGAARGPKPAAEAAPRKSGGDVGASASKKAPFAGGDVQRAMVGAGVGKKSGTDDMPAGGKEGSKNNGNEEATAGEASATEPAARSTGQRQRGTWASVLDSLARDPSNRFLQTAVLSNAGQVLAKSDAFVIETHEACDWTRLFKNKKGDIVVGGHKFVLLSREEGSIIISSKNLGSKMIGSKTRSGSAVIGVYADLSKSQARESVAWLVDALASALPAR